MKSLHAKKGRLENGLFLAEGARLAIEAADLGVWPEILMFAEEARAAGPVARLLDRAAKTGVRCIETSEKVLTQISRRDNPQMLISAYRKLDTALAHLDASGAKLWIALEQVRDPGNLGTVLRTADAAGVAGVILLGHTCDPFSVEAVRASMGAIFATPFAQAELDAFGAWAKQNRLRVIGTDLTAAQRHDEPEAGGGVVLMMGNEQEGLTDRGRALCDELVRIPMAGKADSLNLAAATAVITYDFWRRRGYA
jgi:TrmH family RNA methyltransferase